MKGCTIFLFFCIGGFFQECFAQQFDWISTSFPNSRFMGVYEIDNKLYGAVSNGASYAFDPNTIYQLSLYEIEPDQSDSTGLILNEITTIPFPENYATISIDYIEETELWLLVQSRVLSEGEQKYRVILCDKNFDIIAETSIDTVGYPIPFHIDSHNGMTYVFGSILGPPNDELFFLKYTHSNPYDLPPIEVNQSDPQSMFLITSMTVDKRTEDMLVFYYNGIAELDTNLHQNLRLNYSDIHTSDHGTILGSDINYYSHGTTKQGVGNPLRYLVLQKYDSTFSILAADTFGIQDQDNYPFITKSLDKRNNELLVGGHLDGPLTHFDLAKSIKKFYLAKYDEQLYQLWYKEYGGDRAYIMNGLKLLEDGGSLAYGYVTDTLDGLFYAYIMHVDANGEILTSKTIPSKPQSIQIINPGDETLRVLNPDGINAQIELYDIHGRPVLEYGLNSGLTEIKTGELPSGIYPYTLMRDGRLIGSGIWLKGE